MSKTAGHAFVLLVACAAIGCTNTEPSPAGAGAIGAPKHKTAIDAKIEPPRADFKLEMNGREGTQLKTADTVKKPNLEDGKVEMKMDMKVEQPRPAEVKGTLTKGGLRQPIGGASAADAK